MDKRRNLDVLSWCSTYAGDHLPSWAPYVDGSPSDMIPISRGVFGEGAADSALFTTGGAAAFPLVSTSSDPTLLICKGLRLMTFHCSRFILQKGPWKVREPEMGMNDLRYLGFNH